MLLTRNDPRFSPHTAESRAYPRIPTTELIASSRTESTQTKSIQKARSPSQTRANATSYEQMPWVYFFATAFFAAGFAAAFFAAGLAAALGAAFTAAFFGAAFAAALGAAFTAAFFGAAFAAALGAAFTAAFFGAAFAAGFAAAFFAAGFAAAFAAGFAAAFLAAGFAVAFLVVVGAVAKILTSLLRWSQELAKSARQKPRARDRDARP